MWPISLACMPLLRTQESGNTNQIAVLGTISLSKRSYPRTGPSFQRLHGLSVRRAFQDGVAAHVAEMAQMNLDRLPQPTTTTTIQTHSNNSKGGQPKVENGSDESGELNWKLLEILCLIFAPLRTFEPCNTDVQLSPMPVPTPEGGQAVVLDPLLAEGDKYHGAKVREECLKFLEGGMEGVD
eukprot:c20582_g3_i4.p1 GENE.c20582_g3_i4~~c20582_g3_i4.p1  ORF type:complete len:182 (+),score=35.06 c20582_g3_i4:90-635(+)